IMPYLATLDHIKKLIKAVKGGAEKAGRSLSDIDITDGIPSFISDDLEAARTAAKRGLSGYGRFPFYQRLIKNLGFGDVVEKIKSGVNPAEAFTDELIDAVALVGSAERCRERLEEYRAAGVQLPIIVPNPVGKQNNVEVMKRTVEAFAS
ncbi:MAG: LLM class flavin-dependent oxidoreductase, partial [Thermodesulfobacteriota bacterium]